MPLVLCIYGSVGGSGKTMLAQYIQDRYGGVIVRGEVDLIKKMEEGEALIIVDSFPPMCLVSDLAAKHGYDVFVSV